MEDPLEGWGHSHGRDRHEAHACKTGWAVTPGDTNSRQ